MDEQEPTSINESVLEGSEPSAVGKPDEALRQWNKLNVVMAILFAALLVGFGLMAFLDKNPRSDGAALAEWFLQLSAVPMLLPLVSVYLIWKKGMVSRSVWTITNLPMLLVLFVFTFSVPMFTIPLGAGLIYLAVTFPRNQPER